MKSITHTMIAWATATALLAAAVSADEPRMPPRPERPRHTKHVAPMIVDPEPGVGSSNGVAPASAVAASTAASGTTLSGPATLSYSGTSNALTITDSGTGRALSATLSNTNNANNVIYGQTAGAGAGVAGYNTGTTGPGGKFEMTNSDSYEPALYATTNGVGAAVVATIGNYSLVDTIINHPAVYGSNTAEYGTGVEGVGAHFGVTGATTGQGGLAVEGETQGGGVGVEGDDESGSSAPGFGVVAFSSYGTALYAEGALAGQFIGNVAISGTLSADRPSGAAPADGAYIHNPNGYGMYVASDNSTALVAKSTNARAVDGEDIGNGYGVYGSSASGYAGYFNGPVAGTYFKTLSDRNAKTHIAAVNGADILERINQLPISSWDFKTDLETHHIGPMAQDFHAIFHLGGDDDKHINLSDMAGVTLAAVQELAQQMKAKDAQIAELKSQLAAQLAQSNAVSARLTALEQRDVRSRTAALRTHADAASP